MTQDELLRVIDEAAESGATELDLSYSSYTRGFAARPSGDRLTSLPPEIGQLTALKSLDLSRNRLAELPPDIARLTNLESLSLTSNRLTALPVGFDQLGNLQLLSLTNNLLADLPPDIGRLGGLRLLSLVNNQLTALPPEIGQLDGLRALDLRRNQLTSLPPEIGQLTRLRSLFLTQNQLTSLPPEIGQLVSVKFLSLNGNLLSELPPEIARLMNLQSLLLGQNRLTTLPPEIVERSREPRTILNFYFQHLGADTRPLNEAKVLVVGEGEVGKTSLVRRLVDDEFDANEAQTEGIAIRGWAMDIDGADVRLNVWDFGGQEIMHSTHQFFLSERSVYVVVVDHRKGLIGARLHYWLKIVQSFGGNAPVILVCNKSDIGTVHLDWSRLRREYPTIQDVVHAAAMDGTGREELRGAIRNAVSGLEHLGTPLRTNWFAVKESVERVTEDFIPYAEYDRICSQEGVDDDQSRRTLLRYLHDLGIVLNFEDDHHLAGEMILNPEWVTNGVYAIVNERDLIGNGVVTQGRIRSILDRVGSYPKQHQHFITDMMERFELCYELDPAPAREKRFLIPDLLPADSGGYRGDWRDPLTFVYEYDVLPQSVLSRFIFRMHKHVLDGSHWRTGLVLEIDGNKALVDGKLDVGRVDIFVKDTEARRRSVLSAIRASFEAIHRTISDLSVVGLVPVPAHPDVLVAYDHLLTLEDNHIATYIPEGIDEPVSVKAMLDGVRSEEERPGDCDESEEGESAWKRERAPARRRPQQHLREPEQKPVSTFSPWGAVFALLFVVVVLVVTASVVAIYHGPYFGLAAVVVAAAFGFPAVGLLYRVFVGRDRAGEASGATMSSQKVLAGVFERLAKALGGETEKED